MKLLKTASVPTRKYTDSNGKEKTVWRNVIDLWTDENGKQFLSVDIFFNFAALKPSKEGSDRVFISLFDPRPKDNNNGGSNSNNYGSNINDNSFDNSNDSGVPF